MKYEVHTYTKKPVAIRAVEYDGTAECIDFITTVFPSIKTESKTVDQPGPFTIFTLEGQHICSVGDFVIEGIKGEFYPCKPDIFEGSYNRADKPDFGIPS